MSAQAAETERLRRWRLVLGGESSEPGDPALAGQDLGMDRVLEALYDTERSGGLGKSSPNVARWLGDIRTYFTAPAVKVMQQDALERLNLTQMLLEPEMLEQVEPDVHLVATLLSLSHVIPEKTKDTARQVVRRVVDDLERKLANPLASATSVMGSDVSVSRRLAARSRCVWAYSIGATPYSAWNTRRRWRSVTPR